MSGPEPYQTIYCTDSTLAPGEEQVLTPGREGSVHCTARITRENGTEVSRTVTQEERVLYAPVNAVVARGIDRSSKEQEGAGRAYAPAVEASGRTVAPPPPRQKAAARRSGKPSRACLHHTGYRARPSGNTFTTASGESSPTPKALP